MLKLEKGRVAELEGQLTQMAHQVISRSSYSVYVYIAFQGCLELPSSL